MEKSLFLLLGLASFLVLVGYISATAPAVSAVDLTPQVFFGINSCVRIDGYNNFDAWKFYVSCAMGYDKRTLSPDYTGTCSSRIVDAYRSEADKDKSVAGSICDKAENDIWPFSYKITESGRWDPNLRMCLNPSSCVNGVPSKIVSCGVIQNVAGVCSRSVCGSTVAPECDGVFPGTNVPGGKCSTSCKFESLNPFEFSVSSLPGSASVNQGSSTTVRYTIKGTGGAAQPVSMSCTNIENTGITCNFSPASCTPGTNNECSGDLTIRTSSSTTIRDYAVRITGTYSGTVRYSTFSLSVETGTPTFKFAIWTNPSDGGTVKPGTVLRSTISVLRTQGIEEPVSITCSPNFGVACKLNGVQNAKVECTPRPTCTVSLEQSASIPQSYVTAITGKGTKTISAIATTSYKFVVAEETTTTPDTGDIGDGPTDGPPSSCMDCKGGRCVPCGQGPYRYSMSLSPEEVSVAPGQTAPFTVNIQRGSSSLNGDRSCTVSVRSFWSEDDERPPSGISISFSPTSCTLSPSSQTCSVAGTVRAESSALAGRYNDYNVEARCTVGGAEEENERLSIIVSPFDLDATITPISGTVEKGSSTSAVVNLLKIGGSSSIQPQPVTLSCDGLPIGVSCSFSKMSDVLGDTFSGSFSRRSPPSTDSFGWITNAVETVAGISDIGKGGGSDYAMSLYQAPHRSASVSKTVIVPSLEGRRLFLSFDYKLQNSFGPCTSSFRFCSSCKTCSYDEDSPAPAYATITVSGASSSFSDTVTPGTFTPIGSGQRCSDSRWGRSCTESFSLVDSSGSDIGSVRKETEWTYYFNQCRSSGCPETTYSGGYNTPWKTYSREITSLVSGTATTPLTITLENRRWGTRYDEYFTNSHTSSFDNIRIYAEPGFPGCTPTYSRNPTTGSYGWWCEVPVTISSQTTSASGISNIRVTGHDSANWFREYEYGNIYYDWVTGKNQNYFDLSDTANYQLTVASNCDPENDRTVVTMPFSIVPDQEVPVSVEIFSCDYVAGSPVMLDLSILPDNLPWDSSLGCSIGGVAIGPAGGTAPVVWPDGTISEDGHFKVSTTCKIPSVIEAGSHILRATPTIYPA